MSVDAKLVVTGLLFLVASGLLILDAADVIAVLSIRATAVTTIGVATGTVFVGMSSAE